MTTSTLPRCMQQAACRLLALLLTTYCASAAFAAPGLTPGGLSEFNVELPVELRTMAGRGKLSPITRALVTVAAPANIDMAHVWPVLVVSATSDPGYNSSRRLLRAYAPIAIASGWIVVAADAAEPVTVAQDDVPMRVALNTAALAVLAQQWPGASNAPLAFGGFSGGSKYSGWLAAAFASQGRTIIGVYVAGINQATLPAAAAQFNVSNAAFKRVPVFVQGGTIDEKATPADHQNVVAELKSAGFKNVRLQFTKVAHDIDPAPLKDALDWFREFASVPGTAK